jgi:hypothetical protein
LIDVRWLRVGEIVRSYRSDITPRPENAHDLRKHFWDISDVLHDVTGADNIERGIGERQLLCVSENNIPPRVSAREYIRFI